jgi:hypothetical protein
MEHPRLTHEACATAAIEDVFGHGGATGWSHLIIANQAEPCGNVTEKTPALCERRAYGARVFRRVLARARQVCPLVDLPWKPSVPQRVSYRTIFQPEKTWTYESGKSVPKPRY